MDMHATSEQKKLLEILIFLLKILIFAIPLYVILAFQGILFPLQEIVTINVYYIFRQLGMEVSREGFLLTISGGNPLVFFISEDCTGWKSMLLLTALIFAVPKVLFKKRVLGILLGILAIYLGNLSRILLVVFVERNYGLEFAAFLHDIFWQAGLILLVLVIWISWLTWAGKIKITFLKRLHKLIKPR